MRAAELTDNEQRREDSIAHARRRLFSRFIALEAAPFAGFVVSLSAALWTHLQNSVFAIATIVTLIVMAVVPVIVYGPTRSR